MYGGSASTPQICPGEDTCQVWAGSAGKNRVAKERKVCYPCPMFGTKTDTGKQNHEYLVSLANRSLHLRYERKAGYPVGLHQMSTVQYQTLVLIEEMIEAKEIETKRETAELLTAFVKSR